MLSLASSLIQAVKLVRYPIILCFHIKTKGFPRGGKEYPSCAQTLWTVSVNMSIFHESGEPRANDVLSRLFKITGLTKFPGDLLILAAFATPIQAVAVLPGTAGMHRERLCP
jgi:hypothetical protein